MSKLKESEILVDNDEQHLVFLQPVSMRWLPKEDITAYELAMCIPFFNRVSGVMPYEIEDEPYMRHFIVTDPNPKD